MWSHHDGDFGGGGGGNGRYTLRRCGFGRNLMMTVLEDRVVEFATK